ncbi:annexin VI isoform 1, partial [Reticulomyxa filosa]
LKKSMKGLGTNDELLVRCIAGRSEIDLQEIIVVFNTKFGEGKTLLQWLRDDTSGAYRKILMGLCGFDISNLGGNSVTLHSNSIAEAEKKMDPKASSSSSSSSSSPVDEVKDVDSWDDYCVTSPTVRFNDDVDIDVTARLLAELAAEKKPVSKKLKRKFQTAPSNPKKTSLEDATIHILGKRGKTTAILLVLLTPLAQYRAQIVREGLKNLPVLIETICTCTDKQLKDTISAYNILYKGDMVGDVNKATKSKKKSQLDAHGNHAKELKEKGESSKTDASVWEHFFASKSLTHIKKTAELYAKISELTIMSVAQKVLGNNSFIAADTIFQMATNRFAFFAIKLRDSMKGVGYKADMLTRVLVLRSEIDMGEVQQEFDKSPDQTNNKTLLQWLTDDLSGSFLSTCLRLSGLHSTKPHSNDSDTEYSNVRQKTTTADLANDAMTEDEDENITDTSRTAPLSSSYGGEQSPQPLSTTSIGNDTDTETPRKSAEDSKKASITRTPLSFKVDEFASFVQKRMNDATVNKIWAHLDADNSGEIEKEELLSLLVFTCVLFQAFVAKTNKQDAPKIDKKAMKEELRPMKDWIVESKMVNKESIQKAEFTTLLGGWIMEYHHEISSQP